MVPPKDIKNVPKIIPLGEIPGYKEAVAKENRRRLLAFFDEGFSVCGFKVCALTLRRCLALELAKTPIFRQGAVVTHKDLEMFLWTMSPEFGDISKRKQFYRKCRRSFFALAEPKCRWVRPVWAYFQAKRQFRFETILKRITESIADDFADISKISVSTDEKSFYHPAVSVVSTLMRSQGFRFEEAMEIPVALYNQFLREARENKSWEIHVMKGAKSFSSPLSNPESEGAVEEFKKKLAEENKAKASK